MDKGLIPRRYAKALFEVAADRGVDKGIYGLMQTLTASFAAQPQLCPTIANPFIEVADKVKLLTEAAGLGATKDIKEGKEGKEGKDSAMGTSATAATFSDFLKLLAENKRLDLARDIALAYIDIYRKAHRIYRVEIASAAPMQPAERKRLETVITKHIPGGTMEYDYSVDPSLIGGFTVTVNSERLDASVASALKQLRLDLIQN